MNLVGLPAAELSDAGVDDALGRTVAVLDPLLDLLAEADPLGLRERSHHLGHRRAGGGVGHRREGGGIGTAADAVADALAWLLDKADVPGTAAWADKDLDARIDWWVHRVGALNTVAVAFPGVFGLIADQLPVQDFLGFANQALVLLAVAREMGVEDRRAQVRLLGAVLCERTLPVDERADAQPVERVDRRSPLDRLLLDRVPMGRTIWRALGTARAVGGELAKRPRPRAVFAALGKLPAVGVVADYLGEYGAMARAAKAGRRWIERERALSAG